MSEAVQIHFDADTERFRANVDAAGKAVNRTSEMVAEAKNRILQAFEQQRDAAIKNGAGMKELERIQTRSAANIASVTGSNAQKIINSLERISNKQRAVAAELGKLKIPEIREDRGSDITDRMRASALLRGGGIRSAENFASQFSAFNSIASFAFPALGLATITEEAVRFGKALYDAMDGGGARARQTREEILSVNNSIRDSSTSLDVDIDKLQQERAKLEHKPFNGIKLALDEAAAAAENLQKQLLAVIPAQQKVLEGIAGTSLQRFLGLSSDTDSQHVILSEHERHMMEASSTDDQLKENLSERQVVDKALAADREAKARQDAAIRSGFGPFKPINYGPRIEADQFLVSQNEKEKKRIEKDKQYQDEQAKTQAARDAHGNAGASDKAAAAKLHAAEQYLTQWELLGTATERAVYWYWKGQENSYAKGSSELETVQSKEYEIVRRNSERILEARKKLAEQSAALMKLPAPEMKSFSMLGNNPASDERLQRLQAQLNLSGITENTGIEKLRVEIQAAAGSLTRLDAIQKLAALDAKEHAARLADINQQIALLKASGGFNDMLGRFDSNEKQGQYLQLQGEAQRENVQQQMADIKAANEAAAQTWQGGLREAANAWVNSATDVAGKIRSVLTSSLEAINSELASQLSGKRVRWSNVGDGIAHNFIQSGLSGVEGSVLKMFGLGSKKADGSKSNPYYVVSADSAAQGAGGGFFGGLFGRSDNGGDGGGGGIMSLFGGGKAIGGSVDSSKFYLTGEHGPELFAPGTSGTIIPAAQTKAMMGGGGGGHTFYTINVANGVTPSQMDMHVRAALHQYHGTVKQTSIQAVRDHARRVPTNHR